jgi:holo-[acyl-carrier protein] synthase
MRVGVDIAHVADVRRSLMDFGDGFRRRLFSEQELAACGGVDATVEEAAQGLAARFAAKEATFKLLRVGERVPRWTDIEVVREPGGWTSLRLAGLAQQLADEAGLHRFVVSLSHTSELAIAVVAAEDGGAELAS